MRLHMSQHMQTENMSELYNMEELPEGTFPLSFKLTDRYQR